MLAWSFNHEGKADEQMIASRDDRLNVSTPDKRRHRQDLVRLAHPQCGVAGLRGKFAKPTEPIPGVVEASSR